MPLESATSVSEEPPHGLGEELRAALGPEVSRAPTTRGAFSEVPRGGPEPIPGEIPEPETRGEIEHQLTDMTQDAAEAEIRREHEFQEREAERDRQFTEEEPAERVPQSEEREARNDEMVSTLARQPAPPGEPLPADVLDPPEPPKSAVAPIRRAVPESAAGADDIRDIVQGEREEMVRQLQAEQGEARAAREALEQQVLADRKLADDERDARARELEELARVRTGSEHEKQKRDHDEEMRLDAESQRNLERDEEMRQQLSEITDLLLAHRDEFARKRETVDERWREKQEWSEEMRQQLNEITDLLLAHREEFARKKETVDEQWREKQEWRKETNKQFQNLFRMIRGIIDNFTDAKAKSEERREETSRQFEGLFAMVQGIRDERAEAKEKSEEERRAAAERPSTQKSLSFIPCIHLFSATQDIMDELLRLRESFETLTNCE